MKRKTFISITKIRLNFVLCVFVGWFCFVFDVCRFQNLFRKKEVKNHRKNAFASFFFLRKKQKKIKLRILLLFVFIVVLVIFNRRGTYITL